ncbi:hypothetical protein [Nocardiopsis dassonvillei]|uniref:hypothetical protein n=1 Tax=Nocardiopsis dassonvillei TaxID=2014 RepID=UPI0012FE3AA6|nr:hypothetical protein [Nocardiopsis dassonvillei]
MVALVLASAWRFRREMAENPAGTVNNTSINLGQILKLVQVGNLYGNISFHLGDMVHTETEAVLEEYQRYLAATFSPAEPELYRQFRKEFEQQRWAVLAGEPGNGRETAAIALHAWCGMRVHSISLDEQPGKRLARTLPIPGNGYLVDLSALTRIDRSTVMELRALRARVAENEAALTILTRPGQLTGELHELPVFHVRRPPGIAVLSEHLKYLIGENRQKVWTTWQGVQDKVRDAVPSDAVRLARIAYQSRPTDDRTCTETWIRGALDAYGDWKGELNGWFAEHSGDTGAWNRIALIAVAVLEGRQALEVFDAADDLAQVLGERPRGVGGIFGPGVDLTLETVGAKRVPGDGVCFTRPEYADAVLEYVWEQLPRLRKHLVAWMSGLVAENPQLVTPVREACVRLALSRKDQPLTVDFFDNWAKSARTRQAAADFAAKIASSPDLGKEIRKRLYDIARNPTPDHHQAVAVASACATYGRTNPASALTRLKWLAQAESEKVRQAALDALEELAEDGEQWFDVVGAVLNEWCHEGVSPRRREVAFRFLVRALSASTEGVPERLLWSSTHPDAARAADHVADMWGAVLGRRDDDLALEAVGTWISCVLEDASRFEEVSDILVRAAAGGRSGLSEEAVSRRTVTAGRMIVHWCERNDVDLGTRAVYTLQARLYKAHDPTSSV